jgi:NAD(P)-dependent dehydrogenase (short-subunit alcohol dehydrogenase family)
MPQHAVTTVVDHFGRLDIPVNNAAWNIGIPFGDLDALTPQIWTGSTTPTSAGRSCSPGTPPRLCAPNAAAAS